MFFTSKHNQFYCKIKEKLNICLSSARKSFFSALFFPGQFGADCWEVYPPNNKKKLCLRRRPMEGAIPWQVRGWKLGGFSAGSTTEPNNLTRITCFSAKDFFPDPYFLISDVSGFFLQCVAVVTIFIFLQTTTCTLWSYNKGKFTPDNNTINKLN